MSRPEILGVIPARAGSKGIPKKNLADLCGKPLIAYSIETALTCRVITRTVVSTDSEEIAEVARSFGAEVPIMRPAELARDDSTDLDVFLQLLLSLKEQEGYEPDIVVQLRPTCPIRRAALLQEAVETFIQAKDADSLRSVSVAQQTPFKMWFLGDAGLMRPALELPDVEEPYNMPRQRLPKAYWQNGFVDVMTPGLICDGKTMTGDRVVAFVVNDPVFDIDYREALERAAEYLRRLSEDQSYGTNGEEEWPG